jgi:multiple sugar transport system permease protein
MAIVVLIVAFPTFWVIATSFKTENEWFALPIHWLPETPTLSNYAGAFTSEYGVRAISNSLIVALGGTAIALLTGFPAAYAISRYRTGKFGLFIVPLILRASPPAALAIPLLVFYASVGLVDTAQGLVLVYGATSVFYIIWISKPFIDSVPRELEDAAMADGVSRWRLPFSVVLPIVAGGVVAAAIFVFMLNWTEFTFALILTRFDARTVPLQMATISALGDISEGQGQAAALSTVSLTPFMLIAYFLQKQLVRAFAVGAVRS